MTARSKATATVEIAAHSFTMWIFEMDKTFRGFKLCSSYPQSVEPWVCISVSDLMLAAAPSRLFDSSVREGMASYDTLFMILPENSLEKRLDSSYILQTLE